MSFLYFNVLQILHSIKKKEKKKGTGYLHLCFGGETMIGARRILLIGKGTVHLCPAMITGFCQLFNDINLRL